jgi:Putative auto-transporter adhesin, head GIN domain
VKLSGNVDQLTIVSRGKGSIDATSIITPNVNATLAGSGSLQVKSTADMNLIVDGIGNLSWCSPKVQMDVLFDSYQQKNIVYRC